MTNMNNVERRFAFAGILIEDRGRSARDVHSILSEYSHLIRGRMGIPNLDNNLSVITLILYATTDEIGALSGKIGRLQGVSIKTGISKNN